MINEGGLILWEKKRTEKGADLFWRVYAAEITKIIINTIKGCYIGQPFTIRTNSCSFIEIRGGKIGFKRR
tara:strand:+ start:339 stop:548 length:210 start_codon:yes stop_codon:yes gene_type:complete